MTEAIEHLKYWCKGEPSECGKRVARMLAIWAGGAHHLSTDAMKKCDWANPRFIEVRADTILTSGGLATHDFNNLTSLVFLAHDHCIRVDISPGGPRHLKIMFHPRSCRSGGMSSRHPTIEVALAQYRNYCTEIWAPAADPVEAANG